MRVLITGSRDWDQRNTIAYVLEAAIPLMARDVTIVSGACPTGADKMCEEYAKLSGWNIERHPAQWTDEHGKYHPEAGFIRNAEMVKLGADICLAFIKNESKGAGHTATLAEKAGIKTQRILA